MCISFIRTSTVVLESKTLENGNSDYRNATQNSIKKVNSNTARNPFISMISTTENSKTGDTLMSVPKFWVAPLLRKLKVLR